MSEAIRVMLVDDHAVLRAGVRALLEDESDIKVVGEADTGEQALERLKQAKPDVVVMDLDMPGMGGLEATRRIATMEDGPRVLILTLHAEDDFLLPVLEAGGNGYLTKRGPDEDLFRAIRTVHRGEVFLYPAAAKLLLQKYKAGDEHSPVEQLSERERDVMTLTAEGFSSTEIGKKLYISPKTVDTYRARVMQKLGLSHRSELVRFALNTGLLRAD
jgi:DNA-binding NarL/FixJ family response regulator